MMIMEFKQILMERYAVKLFDGRDIGEDKLNAIIDMARLTPSGMNIQPWKVKVVRGNAAKEMILPVVWNRPQIGTCSHLLIFCANMDFEGHTAMLVEGMRTAGVTEEYIRTLEGAIHHYKSSHLPAQMLVEAQAQALMAALTAIYAAKSMGVDSCPVMAFDVSGLAKALALPSTLIPVVIVPLGFPADKPMSKFRFPKEEMVF